MGAVIELTDEEWVLVKHLFDPAVHRGIKGTIPKREIVDAILWLARTGCQWRHLPDRFPDWQAVWSQWRWWRDNGTWAAAMRVLAREIRLRHKRKADPTMVMIDGQTVKGGRAGPTFHEAGGRGGYTRGAKRTILIEILGLPLAVSVESAKPHDVQSARRILKDQLDAPPAQQPKLPGLQAIVADRGYTGLAALASSHGLNLDIKRPPAAPMLPPAKPGGKPRKGKRSFTPIRPLYKVENTFARLGMWRRLLLRADGARRADLARGRLRGLPLWSPPRGADLTAAAGGWGVSVARSPQQRPSRVRRFVGTQQALTPDLRSRRLRRRARMAMGSRPRSDHPSTLRPW